MPQNIDIEQLYAFFYKASHASYVGGGKPLENPERDGFVEYEYEEGVWHYRDSYTGWFRSAGTELIRFEDKPIWFNSYGGGMLEKNKQLARDTFSFLVKALKVDNKGFMSARGPEEMKLGSWEYKYKQDGAFDDYSGYEEVKYKKRLVFYHRTIGGIIKGK